VVCVTFDSSSAAYGCQLVVRTRTRVDAAADAGALCMRTLATSSGLSTHALTTAAPAAETPLHSGESVTAGGAAAAPGPGAADEATGSGMVRADIVE
jgi:hypothetical protein